MTARGSAGSSPTAAEGRAPPATRRRESRLARMPRADGGGPPAGGVVIALAPGVALEYPGQAHERRQAEPGPDQPPRQRRLLRHPAIAVLAGAAGGAGV